MSASKVRVGGSGLTTMTWRGTKMAYLQTLADSTPQPQGAVSPVQPIDEPVPLEIVTPLAVGAGSISLSFFELWNEPAWAMLPGLEGTNTLLDVLKRQISLGEITCRKIIKSPDGIMRAKVYHGVVVTNIDEGESIQINTMLMPKTVQLGYTYSTVI
jgi:hypothetical protein